MDFKKEIKNFHLFINARYFFLIAPFLAVVTIEMKYAWESVGKINMGGFAASYFMLLNGKFYCGQWAGVHDVTNWSFSHLPLIVKCAWIFLLFFNSNKLEFKDFIYSLGFGSGTWDDSKEMMRFLALLRASLCNSCAVAIITMHSDGLNELIRVIIFNFSWVGLTFAYRFIRQNHEALD